MNKKTGNILLRDALIEAMLREFDRDMEKCEESPICSLEHYKKMSEIVGFDVTKPRRKPIISTRTKIAIIIIAAALALTSCIAIFYRQIGNFMEEVYEKYIKVHFVEETSNAPTEIEDVYTLSYVPEGYYLIEQEINESFIYHKYSNNFGGSILIVQSITNKTNMFLDSENGEATTIDHEQLSIYWRILENKNYYRWKYNEYSFSMCTHNTLPNIEVTKIIDGMICK